MPSGAAGAVRWPPSLVWVGPVKWLTKLARFHRAGGGSDDPADGMTIAICVQADLSACKGHDGGWVLIVDCFDTG